MDNIWYEEISIVKKTRMEDYFKCHKEDAIYIKEKKNVILDMEN